jgi:hypothetical protein
MSDGIAEVIMESGLYSYAVLDTSRQQLLEPYGCLRTRLEVAAGLQKLQEELAKAGRPMVVR